jgi:transcriptional regulator with PAS, ATPase and Fis domain
MRSEYTLHLQAKLLSVLQNRQVNSWEAMNRSKLISV